MGPLSNSLNDRILWDKVIVTEWSQLIHREERCIQFINHVIALCKDDIEIRGACGRKVLTDELELGICSSGGCWRTLTNDEARIKERWLLIVCKWVKIKKTPAGQSDERCW